MTSIASSVVFILGGHGQGCASLLGLLPHLLRKMAAPDWLYANKCLFHWLIWLGLVIEVGWLLTRQQLLADRMYSSLGL